MGRVFLISAVSAAMGIGFFAYWFSPGIVSLGIYSALAIVASGLSVAVYFLAGYAKKDARYALIKREIDKEQLLYQKVKNIASELAGLDQELPSKQASRLMGMLEDYRQVIEQKLGDTTITVTSYSQETGRVFNLVINNLSDILAAARSVRTVSNDDVREEAIESDAIARRQALLTQQDSRIDLMVEQNRELLTVLNETTVQVANIQDLDSFELKESLNRLKELGARAQAFSKE